MKYQSALSLPIAAACLVFLSPNLAAAKGAATRTTSKTVHSSIEGQREAMRMVPAQAELTEALNGSTLRPGEKFDLRLSKKVHLKNGPVLPKGSELVGKVVKDQMNEAGKPSTLTLRFTEAKLKKGKDRMIPIKATIVGLYSASQYASIGGENNWTPKTLQIDQIGALRGVDLHSKIASGSSGVLKSKKNDIRFSRGTEFELAIAKRA